MKEKYRKVMKSEYATTFFERDVSAEIPPECQKEIQELRERLKQLKNQTIDARNEQEDTKQLKRVLHVREGAI